MNVFNYIALFILVNIALSLYVYCDTNTIKCKAYKRKRALKILILGVPILLWAVWATIKERC